VPLCEYATENKDQLRNHWCARHWNDTFQADGESRSHEGRSYPTVGDPPADSRLEPRANAEAASTAAPKFYVGDTEVEQVTSFRYLGRILSENDEDLPACIRKMDRARTKWKAVSRVLKRDGSSQRSLTRFYLVIDDTSDTWRLWKNGSRRQRNEFSRKLYFILSCTTYVSVEINALLSRYLHSRTIYAKCRFAAPPSRPRPTGTYWNQTNYQMTE
jgi:hypothetical protein